MHPYVGTIDWVDTCKDKVFSCLMLRTPPSPLPHPHNTRCIHKVVLAELNHFNIKLIPHLREMDSKSEIEDKLNFKYQRG